MKPIEKKRLIPIILFFVLCVLGVFGYQIISTIEQKKKIAKSIQSLPAFNFETLENIKFTNQNLKKNTSVVFFYFNSECELCHYEAMNINDNIEKLMSFQLILISTESPNKIKEFANKHRLFDKKNILKILNFEI